MMVFYQAALSKELTAAVCSHLYLVSLGWSCALTEAALAAFREESFEILRSHTSPCLNSL